MAFNPDLSLIRPFSKEAGAEKPAAPYAALFQQQENQLCFVAAKHGAPETLEAVRQVFDDFKPEIVIVEGVSGATPPAEYLERVRKQSLDGFKQGGEGALATMLAAERGINFIPGEPTDEEVHQSILQQGKITEDLLGWHAALMLQQKNRGAILKPQDVPQAIQKALDSYTKRLGLKPSFGFHEFCAWYEQRMGKKFNPEAILKDDMSPGNSKNANFLQKIMHATDQAREPHILKTIAEQLSKHKRVLVVYGASHFIKQEAVLTKMLGRPKIQGHLDAGARFKISMVTSASGMNL